MDTIFVIVNLLVASFAFVAPWATIEAFDAGRLAGRLDDDDGHHRQPRVYVVCHVA